MIRPVALVLALACAAPALAVGLGPLAKSGLTDSADKAFWLTLINSEERSQDFSLTAFDADWQPVAGVDFIPAAPRLGPLRQRRVLVRIHTLSPGETRTVRVCAEPTLQEGPVHARVCSKLVVRRVAGAHPG